MTSRSTVTASPFFPDLAAQAEQAPMDGRSSQTARPLLTIGLMSGTSLDGVDGVLASWPPGEQATGTQTGSAGRTIASAFVAFPDALRADLMALQQSGENEIDREARVANRLAQLYAACVAQLLGTAQLAADAIAAIGVHGQTIRHAAERGYTRQTNNAALLAELTGIDVVADFRSRDIAAGGQGAPLVPAFHRQAFGAARETRVVLNLGGIANISVLPASADDPEGQGVIGFDTGPANLLMDGWIWKHRGRQYDDDGAWAATGKVDPVLLERLRAHAFFALPPPKSTGRDLFHADWLETVLAQTPACDAVDVQATLAALTASTVADAIARHAPGAKSVHVCGGGAANGHLMDALRRALEKAGSAATVDSTETLGVPAHHVEALAFAWLAKRFLERSPGNLPAVTGARGPRILGALYPA